MKKSQLISTITLAFSTLALTGQAQAVVIGESSNTSYIQVGESNTAFPPHVIGKAGIAVPALGLANKVDFQGLTAYGTIDGNGIYTLSFPYTGAPSDHNDLGVFNFAQVGTSDVWFGEWSDDGSVLSSTRTVYYSGSNPDSSVPTSGIATYTVKAANNYYNGTNDLLSGVLTADFGAATLTGSMSNSLYNVNIGTTTINADASITGSGTASLSLLGVIPVTSGGDVSGQFYNGQADLAGMVDFSGTVYDTAFGGTKN